MTDLTRRSPAAIGFVLILMAAAGSAAWFAVRAPRIDAPERMLAALKARPRDTRPFDARLTGFRYAPVDTRRSAVAGEEAAVDARLLAARLEKRLEAEPTAAAYADAAAGALLAGDVTRAIDFLETAREIDPASPRVLSDLAAAYLVRAAPEPAVSLDHVRALDAALAAIGVQPDLPDAWFNRAVAAERLLPADGAREAWSRYVQIDPVSAWAREASRRAARPEPASEPRPDAFLTAPLAELGALAARWPQRARESFLEVVVPGWGDAVIGHRRDDAQDAATRAALIAGALFDATEDPSARLIAARMNDPAWTHRLARAAIGYRAGRRAFEELEWDSAVGHLRRAARELPEVDPLRIWIDLEIARIAMDERRTAEARRLLAGPLARAGAAGYRAAVARATWHGALVDFRSNRLDSAIAAHERAVRLLDELGEHENRLSARTSAAHHLRLRGERERSWAYTLEVLGRSHELVHPHRRFVAYLNAALFASGEGWAGAALLFQEEAVRIARASLPSLFLVEALTGRGHFLFRLNRPGEAETALAEAARILEAGGGDAYVEASLDAARGEGYAASRPGDAEPALTRALEYFSRTDAAICAHLRLLRARVRLALGRPDDAEADYREGIEDVEERRLGTAESALRISYLDTAAGLFTEMVALQLDLRGNSDRAFDYLERGRARALLDAGGGPVLSITEVQAALPPSVALVAFKTLPARIVAWVVTRDRRGFVDLGSPIADVATASDQFRQLVQRGSTAEVRAASHGLHAALLRPLEPWLEGAAALVVVADGALARAPFAALVSARGRFLVEELPVTMMPSAAAFVAASRAAAARGADGPAVLASAPAVNPEAFPGLPPLPGAAGETAAIARVYERKDVLAGRDATRERFLRALAGAGVVHFAGHAVDNRDNPLRSALVLAPSAESADGALRAGEIAALRLPRTRLVVLAACDTAEGRVSPGEGLHSLARSFLEAGVPNVIATLWQIEDEPSAALFSELHRANAVAGDPAGALRSAQLTMIAAGARPATWAGVVAIGATR